MVLLCLMYFMTYLDRVNVSSAAAGFGKEFGLNSTQIGLVFSAFAYPYLVFQVMGGWLSDRFGAKRTLIACGLVWATATVLTGLAIGLMSMLAARLLLGLGEGATLPAASTAMSRWVPKGEARLRARRHPRRRTNRQRRRAGRGSGCHDYVRMARVVLRLRGNQLSVGPRVGSRVHRISRRSSAHYSGGVAGALRQRPRYEAAAANPLAAAHATYPPVTAVYFCYGWTLWLFLSWLPQYFLHSYGLDLKQSAFFSSSVFFAGVIGDTLGGVVTDRLLRRTGNLRLARSRMVCVCMAASLVSLIPLLFLHATGVALVCLSLGFFFAEMTIGPMWAIPMDIAPEYAGTACGIMNTGSALAAIVSPVVSER